MGASGRPLSSRLEISDDMWNTGSPWHKVVSDCLDLHGVNWEGAPGRKCTSRSDVSGS